MIKRIHGFRRFLEPIFETKRCRQLRLSRLGFYFYADCFIGSFRFDLWMKNARREIPRAIANLSKTNVGYELNSE